MILIVDTSGEKNSDKHPSKCHKTETENIYRRNVLHTKNRLRKFIYLFIYLSHTNLITGTATTITMICDDQMPLLNMAHVDVKIKNTKERG